MIIATGVREIAVQTEVPAAEDLITSQPQDVLNLPDPGSKRDAVETHRGGTFRPTLDVRGVEPIPELDTDVNACHESLHGDSSKSSTILACIKSCMCCEVWTEGTDLEDSDVLTMLAYTLGNPFSGCCCLLTCCCVWVPCAYAYEQHC